MTKWENELEKKKFFSEAIHFYEPKLDITNHLVVPKNFTFLCGFDINKATTTGYCLS
jgi:hypothetical protein